MNRRAVPAVLEEVAGATSTDRRIAVPIASIRASRMRASALRIRPLILARASSQWAQGPASRAAQVEQFAASLLDELPDLRTLVGAEVVHHHNLSGPQVGSGRRPSRHKLRTLCGGSLADHRQARPHPLRTHARQERRVSPAGAAALIRARPLSFRSPAVRSQTGLKTSKNGVLDARVGVRKGNEGGFTAQRTRGHVKSRGIRIPALFFTLSA